MGIQNVQCISKSRRSSLLSVDMNRQQLSWSKCPSSPIPETLSSQHVLYDLQKDNLYHLGCTYSSTSNETTVKPAWPFGNSFHAQTQHPYCSLFRGMRSVDSVSLAEVSVASWCAELLRGCSDAGLGSALPCLFAGCGCTGPLWSAWTLHPLSKRVILSVGPE